eukprot:scaffold819_cov239-Pinguiococcus_pyrenoidosus.AAC.15
MEGGVFGLGLRIRLCHLLMAQSKKWQLELACASAAPKSPGAANSHESPIGSIECIRPPSTQSSNPSAEGSISRSTRAPQMLLASTHGFPGLPLLMLIGSIAADIPDILATGHLRELQRRFPPPARRDGSCLADKLPPVVQYDPSQNSFGWMQEELRAFRNP